MKSRMNSVHISTADVKGMKRIDTIRLKCPYPNMNVKTVFLIPGDTMYLLFIYFISNHLHKIKKKYVF